MSISIERLALLFVTTGFLFACAAKPPNIQPIAPTSDITQELETTQKMLDQAKENNLEVLAPKNYERAQLSLNKAREQVIRGKSNEKVLQNVAESRGWLKEAEAKGEITRAAAKNLSDARSGAIRANAPNLYQKEFRRLDEETRELASDAEKGDLGKATKEGDKLTKRYRDLEIQSLTKNFLTEAQDNLKAAQKDGAEKNTPQTYRQTETKINQTLSLIHENPRNTEAIGKSAMEATAQSKFLLEVNQKTKQGNTEALVLQSEKQRRVISGLTVGLAASESELLKKEAALKTAEELREQLRPDEAEVYVDGNAVKVRLKGVQFGSNQTKINKKSADLLEKVDRVLGTVGVSQVTVEGHTDSIGTPQANQDMSLKRAEAVQDYFVSKGRVVPEKVRAVGRGSEEPISDNKTPSGRSQNRRIDLVIEPEFGARVE